VWSSRARSALSIRRPVTTILRTWWDHHQRSGSSYAVFWFVATVMSTGGP